MAGLTENHARSLLASIQYATKLLRECDDALDASSGREVLPRYSGTVPAPTLKVSRDYLDRLREQLRRTVAAMDLHPPPPNRSALHTINTSLLFLDNTFEEMRSAYLRGYGDVPPEAGGVLDGVVTELQQLVHEFETFLTGGSDDQLHAQLDRLGNHPASDRLRELSQLIAADGLVDLRPALTLLIERALENTYEVGVIGRVSSGKSSLLNALIGTSILPTGVLPVTAFPTRVRRGPAARLDVSFADGSTQTLPLDRIDEFVTEERNPGNAKRLIRIVVEYPGERLPQGVTFVDTPGLGSVASRGALQTLAYLPRCDHATFLFEATAPVTNDDLDVMAYLRDAGIGSSVLLSKADLLSSDDLARVREYVAAQVGRRIGDGVVVRAISALPEHDAMLQEWLRQDLAPLAAAARLDASAGIVRKAQALRAQVTAATSRHGAPPAVRQAAEQGLKRLREISARLERHRRKLLELPEQRSSLVDDALAGATAACIANAPGLTTNNDAIRTALLRPAETLAAGIADDLNACARDIQIGLTDAASSLGRGAPELDVPSVAQGVPMMDLPPIAVELRPPLWARAGRLAGNWTRDRIHEQLAQTVDAAAAAYLEVLKRWAIERLTNLRREYESHSRALQLTATKG